MSKPDDLKKLQKIWYAKLAKKGFVDIEEPNSQHEMLSRWDGAWFRTRYQTVGPTGTKYFDATRFEAKQRYFQLAESLLNDQDIKWKAKERKIWTLHSQGLSLREIQSATRVHYTTVHEIVRRYRRLIIWK